MTMPTPELLLLAASSVVFTCSIVVAVIAFLFWRSATAEHTASVQQGQTTLLQRLGDLETRVDATKLSVSQLHERFAQPQQATSPVTGAAPGYQIAIRLARGGASQQELITGCGLSATEAELIQRLHAPQAARRDRARIHAV